MSIVWNLKGPALEESAYAHVGFMHACFKQVPAEAILCVKHSARYWKCSGDQEGRHDPHAHGDCILAEEIKKLHK